MSTNPFADLQLPPEMVKAANDVHEAMSKWIDQQVLELKIQMNSRAASVANAVATEAQQKLKDVLSVTDGDIVTIQSNLAKIQASFTISTPQELKDMATNLDAAIKAHQAAVAKQQAQIQAFGTAIGGVIQKALLAA